VDALPRNCPASAASAPWRPVSRRPGRPR